MTVESYAHILGANDLRSEPGASAPLRHASRKTWATKPKALLT